MSLTITSLRALGWNIPADVQSIECVAARLDYPANQAEDSCPYCDQTGGSVLVVVSLRTTTGTLGSGAHPGQVYTAHIDCVSDEIAAIWLPVADTIDSDGNLVCADCASALGGETTEAPGPHTPCESCRTQFLEYESDNKSSAYQADDLGDCLSRALHGHTIVNENEGDES